MGQGGPDPHTWKITSGRGVSVRPSAKYFFFHFLVLQEYWVLKESRIPLKPVVGSVIMVALSISSHKQTQ